MTISNMNRAFYRVVLSLVFLVAFCCATRCGAQGTAAFSYQGYLQTNGTAANGNFDFTFALFETDSNGTEVIAPITNLDVVVSNGDFNLSLDFGSNIFNGKARWLQIGYRTNGSDASFATVSPRQQILAVPYALYAMTSASSAGPAGPQGPVGPKGATGLQGPAGTKGATGLEGPAGPKGATGATGATGLQGPAGTKGATGLEGPAGPKGATGSQGPDGPKGATGPQGPVGPQGLPGGSIGSQGQIGLSQMQIFDTNSVFLVPAGVSNVIVELWGGGGGGGLAFLDTDGLAGAGGGGGGGAYAKTNFAVTPGTQTTITIGEGGNSAISLNGEPTSFGNVIFVYGGTNGSNGFKATNKLESGAGGPGGAATGENSLPPQSGTGRYTNNIIYGAITGENTLPGQSTNNSPERNLNSLPGQSGTYSANDTENFGGNGGASPSGGQGGRGAKAINGGVQAIPNSGEAGQIPGGGGGGGGGVYMNNNGNHEIVPPGLGGHGRVIVYY